MYLKVEGQTIKQNGELCLKLLFQDLTEAINEMIVHSDLLNEKTMLTMRK